MSKRNTIVQRSGIDTHSDAIVRADASEASEQMDRRSFLKTGFIAGALGLGCFSSLTSLTACSEQTTSSAASYSTGENALTAQHWGIVVDVRQLHETVGVEHVAAACHLHHNVPSIDDPKTEVKWIWEDTFEHSFEDLEHSHLPNSLMELKLPVLCNHYENPPCVRVCPTEATFKRDDGIVAMDYHRCIGCRFCMTACPYNARSLNFSDPRPFLDEIYPDYPTREKGVVEKCNFCAERLEQGLAPYCVETSGGAIFFGDLKDPHSEARQALARGLSIRRLTKLATGPSVYYLLDTGQQGSDTLEEDMPHREGLLEEGASYG